MFGAWGWVFYLFMVTSLMIMNLALTVLYLVWIMYCCGRDYAIKFRYNAWSHIVSWARHLERGERSGDFSWHPVCTRNFISCVCGILSRENMYFDHRLHTVACAVQCLATLVSYDRNHLIGCWVHIHSDCLVVNLNWLHTEFRLQSPDVLSLSSCILKDMCMLYQQSCCLESINEV